MGLKNNQRLFHKHSKTGGGDDLLAEAAGLAAIAETGTLNTPRIIEVGKDALVTAWVGGGAATETGWRELGRQLAAMHKIEQPGFGFTGDNFCGATVQRNTPCNDGWEFFTEQRLMYQGQLAQQQSLLGRDDVLRLESIARQLPELIPPQSPALLHGDLWRGNVVFNEAGKPCVIDPAAYWGWPEADLAMTLLFGGFGAAFYDAYLEVRPLESGWSERVPIYNLYHLLNHLNLFGSGYLAETQAVLDRYA